MNTEQIILATQEIVGGVSFEDSSFSDSPKKYLSEWNNIKKDLDSLPEGTIIDIPNEMPDD